MDTETKVKNIMDSFSDKTKDLLSANIGNIPNSELRSNFNVNPGSLRLALIKWRKKRGIAKVTKNQEESE